MKTCVEAVLRTTQLPYLNTDLISAKTVKTLDVSDDGGVTIGIDLGYPCARYAAELEAELNTKLLALEGIKAVNITIAQKIAASAIIQGTQALPGVKNIIAIGSGKGGVGKSTTAVNLALALQYEGARVGILDADIYGPSIPTMLGATTLPQTKDDKYMLPVDCHGLQTMSIGYLLEQDDTPMIWRGPMVTRALQQLLTDTLWDDLDYLLIDLPPGTGDIQLSLTQKIPLSGAIIVTTPQDIATLDARKALRMFEKVNVPVLGVVENMSLHHCSACGHEEAIFGEGGASYMARHYQVPLLGALPLHVSIREQADCGKPSVIADPETKISQNYRSIALSAAARLAQQAKNWAVKFPKIVIENA